MNFSLKQEESKMLFAICGRSPWGSEHYTIKTHRPLVDEKGKTKGLKNECASSENPILLRLQPGEIFLQNGHIKSLSYLSEHTGEITKEEIKNLNPLCTVSALLSGEYEIYIAAKNKTYSSTHIEVQAGVNNRLVIRVGREKTIIFP